MFGWIERLGAAVWGWADRSFPWTNVYGVARSLLAFGTASTLLFNKSEIFFRPGQGISQFPICAGITRYGTFCLGEQHLEFTRWICIFVLVIVASGWRPRYTAIFHWWVSFSLQTSAITLDGGDQIAAVLTFLLLPIALTDDRKWHWQSIPHEDCSSLTEALRRTTALTTLLAIRFQVFIIYFHAAVGKLSVGEWLNGTVLYYWLIDPMFGLPNWLRVLTPLITSPLVVLLTWGTLLLEVGLFMALVMPRRVWKYRLIAGILFHVVIAITMGLISFGIAMCAALVLYLRPFEQEFTFAFAKNLLRRSARLEPLSPTNLADPNAR